MVVAAFRRHAAEASPGEEWARLALDGMAATGTALEHGIVIGTARTSTALVATGETGTADGVGGMAADGGIPGIMWSLLAIMVFRGGGVGAGVHGLTGEAAGVTRMDITATAIPTTAAMVILTMVTAMVTAASTSSNGYGGQYQSQYGNGSQSRVAELQRRLQRAGYYHGSVDGVLGPQTRSAIRAYEQEHGDVG